MDKMLQMAAAGGLAVLGLLLQGAEALKAAEVPDVLKDESGQLYVEAMGQRWNVYDSEKDGKPFFLNPQSSAATWVDPRSFKTVVGPEVAAKASISVWLVAIVPVILFLSAVAGRIAYLQMYYPDLLWPTRERKKRFKNHMHTKPQKARGKWSQDGKGGRSAN